MNIIVDDLSGIEVIALLEEHLQHMYSITPPESVHALDVGSLKAADVTFWSAWEDSTLLGCGALKQLTRKTAEIKSMRTVSTHSRKGVAATLVTHIIAQARIRGYEQLFLETGSMDEFIPARALYEKHGFQSCQPFADYVADPNSAFYSLAP